MQLNDGLPTCLSCAMPSNLTSSLKCFFLSLEILVSDNLKIFASFHGRVHIMNYMYISYQNRCRIFPKEKKMYRKDISTLIYKTYITQLQQMQRNVFIVIVIMLLKSVYVEKKDEIIHSIYLAVILRHKKKFRLINICMCTL